MPIVVRSFDEILEGILASYRGQKDKEGNEIDTSVGSQTYIDAAALASVAHGLEYKLKHVEQQTLPNLSGAETGTINGWYSAFGGVRIPGENDGDVLVKMDERINEPAAGGIDGDWKEWAKIPFILHGSGWSEESEGVERVVDVEVAEGVRRPGSIDVNVISNISDAPLYTGSEASGDVVRSPFEGVDLLFTAKSENPSAPVSNGVINEVEWYCGSCSQRLLDAVHEECNESRPLGLTWNFRVNSVSLQVVNIEIEVDKISDNESAVAEIRGLIDGGEIGQQLFTAQLSSVAVVYGSGDVNVVAPTGVVGGAGVKLVCGNVIVREVG